MKKIDWTEQMLYVFVFAKSATRDVCGKENETLPSMQRNTIQPSHQSVPAFGGDPEYARIHLFFRYDIMSSDTQGGGTTLTF